MSCRDVARRRRPPGSTTLVALSGYVQPTTDAGEHAGSTCTCETRRSRDCVTTSRRCLNASLTAQGFSAGAQADLLCAATGTGGEQAMTAKAKRREPKGWRPRSVADPESHAGGCEGAVAVGRLVQAAETARGATSALARRDPMISVDLGRGRTGNICGTATRGPHCGGRPSRSLSPPTRALCARPTRHSQTKRRRRVPRLPLKLSLGGAAYRQALANGRPARTSRPGAA